MRNVLVIALIALIAVAFWVGKMASPEPTNHPVIAESQTSTWTCSMHPEIHVPHAGKCPKCGMDLIPEISSEDREGPRSMAFSKTAQQLAEVETALVERRSAEVSLRMFGKIEVDESQVKTISAYVGGRLNRLYVDTTGIPVKKGEHLVDIYSPELYTAQEEFLLAAASAKLGGLSERQGAESTAKAAREKLALLGLSEDQIAEVEKLNKPSAILTLRAPMSGVVLRKEVTEGAYVMTGNPLYTLADLSQVWVVLDVYEQDLAWLRYRQIVNVSTEAYGDENFTGWVSFIDPVLNAETRTVRVRVLLDNKEGRFKPNMFVRATAKIKLGAKGLPIAPELQGKWICPMHGQAFKDASSPCEICGMALVQATALGYDSASSGPLPLVIPLTAPLLTGTRAIVYVDLPNKDSITYEARTVELGPKAGDFYIVRSGLQEA